MRLSLGFSDDLLIVSCYCYIIGSYTKFNSNMGYVDSSIPLYAAAHAFSHWTYNATKGYLMVTDFQLIVVRKFFEPFLRERISAAIYRTIPL